MTIFLWVILFVIGVDKIVFDKSLLNKMEVNVMKILDYVAFVFYEKQIKW